jgi:hypothetical protein
MHIKHFLYKEPIPLAILYSLFEKICNFNDSYYFIDKNVFNRMVFCNIHFDFLKEIENYYHDSKKYFVNRKFTYNSFVNIIRQICSFHNIRYQQNKKYNNSQYTICYFVDK